MGDYLKLFETYSEYETYITGNDKILPNVSYCEDNKCVHYNPWVDTRLIGTFNVTSTTSATSIIYSRATSQFSEIEIDGVVQPSVTKSYQFSTTGEHTVKYTLVDPTSIGDSAFSSCANLTSIAIPSGVTSIGNYAFNNCKGLTEFTIPSSVTNIGNGILNSCTNLTTIMVDNENTVYDSRNNCDAIIETATNTLIAGCKDTVVPNTVIVIGQNAFRGCVSLATITIPNSVTTIGASAFDGCGFTSIGGIGSGADLEIPSSLTSINDYAFRNCTSLTNVTIPDNVTSIGDMFTFYNCSNLINVIIGNGVTTIGASAFAGCINLTNITIGSGVTRISKYAFQTCVKLNVINSMATTAPSLSNTFDGIKSNGTLYVPIGSSGYDSWMSTQQYRLGYYNWTKVEQ